MKVQKMNSYFLKYINNIKVLILNGREIRQQELKNEREKGIEVNWMINGGRKENVRNILWDAVSRERKAGKINK